MKKKLVYYNQHNTILKTHVKHNTL